jgi:hypothetical protein
VQGWLGASLLGRRLLSTPVNCKGGAAFTACLVGDISWYRTHLSQCMPPPSMHPRYQDTHSRGDGCACQHTWPPAARGAPQICHPPGSRQSRTCNSRCMTSSRPTTGSSRPRLASAVRSRPNFCKAFPYSCAFLQVSDPIFRLGRARYWAWVTYFLFGACSTFVFASAVWDAALNAPYSCQWPLPATRGNDFTSVCIMQ